MKRLLWTWFYLCGMLEAIWHGFADRHHYAAYWADLAIRPRLKGKL